MQGGSGSEGSGKGGGAKCAPPIWSSAFQDPSAPELEEVERVRAREKDLEYHRATLDVIMEVSPPARPGTTREGRAKCDVMHADRDWLKNLGFTKKNRLDPRDITGQREWRSSEKVTSDFLMADGYARMLRKIKLKALPEGADPLEAMKKANKSAFDPICEDYDTPQARAGWAFKEVQLMLPSPTNCTVTILRRGTKRRRTASDSQSS